MIYFASDFHLGVPDYTSSLEREKRVVKWLESIRHDATEIYLLGDIFDFWFEYRHVAPKGYVRLLGKLAELVDSGIEVHWLVGNHDMWMFGYLQQEIGVKVYMEPVLREWDGKKFFIGHGDGLGPGDHSYKFIKKIFRHKFFQWLYARFHPNFAFWVANSLSRRSRKNNYESDKTFLGENKEWLVLFCREHLQHNEIDFFVFGHRHLLLDITLPRNARYINLGDWFKQGHYASWGNNEFKITAFQE